MDLFNRLHRVMNFNCDGAANEENALLEMYFSEQNSFFNCTDTSLRIFCNPPYNRTKDFVAHAIKHKLNVCFLVPARTDTKWFQMLPFCFVYFIAGRLKFSGSDVSAPFPSCLIFLNSEPKIADLKYIAKINGTGGYF